MKFIKSKSLSWSLAGFIILVFTILFFIVLPNRIEEPGFVTPIEEYKVLEVTDGDTIVILMNGRRDTVRLIGIDTPELSGPYTEEECFGKEASNRTKELLKNQNVKLLPDSLSANRDKYNRLLRYVYLRDGTMVNQLLLNEGVARLYPWPNFDLKDEFVQAELNAQKANYGLWETCN